MALLKCRHFWQSGIAGLSREMGKATERTALLTGNHADNDRETRQDSTGKRSRDRAQAPGNGAGFPGANG